MNARERHNATQRNYRKRNLEKERLRVNAWTRIRDFSRIGWTLERFKELFEKQKGLCAICGRLEKLCADHDHETISPRELLCGHCNKMLGLSLENPKTLEAAAAYLRKWGKI